MTNFMATEIFEMYSSSSSLKKVAFLLTFCLALSCVESLSLTSLSNKRPFSSLSSSASVSSSEVTTTGNEDSNTERSSVDHLPMCVSAASSCGLVQLNGRGVNRVQTCQCPHRRSCPLDWDPFSDNTLIHGNDHYKFCSGVPALRPCLRGQVVSSHVDDFSEESKLLVSDHRIHCMCPHNHLFVRNSSNYLELEGQGYRISVTYSCLPPPICSVGETCMSVAETMDSSFSTRLCRCPRGSFCPRDTKLASKQIALGKGIISQFECRTF